MESVTNLGKGRSKKRRFALYINDFFVCLLNEDSRSIWEKKMGVTEDRKGRVGGGVGQLALVLRAPFSQGLCTFGPGRSL